MKVHPKIVRINEDQWGVDITKYMKNLFGDILSKAVLIYFAETKSEAMSIANDYVKMYEKNEQTSYDFDGDAIEMEFVNGKRVHLDNSEWAKICEAYVGIPDFERE